jgi:putative ABC transport system substrate-binding protein
MIALPLRARIRQRHAKTWVFSPARAMSKVDWQEAKRRMRRREFVTLLGGAATWPLAARAQQAGKTYRIGVFTSATPVFEPAYRALVDELRKQGFVDGQNLVVDRRQTDQTPAELAANVAEMVRSKVDVIVVSGLATLQAAAGTGLPIIVSANNFDPIVHGYVKSLAQPGGNVTGVVLRQTELAEKQVELLTQAFPDRKRLAMQWDIISADQFNAADRRAKALGLDVISIQFERPLYDIAAAFRRITEGGAHMHLHLSSPFLGRHTQDIIDLTIEHRLPTMFIFRRYVELGGLMSYGADNVAMYRQTALYAAKVLRGAKPADLPVEQPNTFELVVNLKTARAIGVELPTAILLRANEVIE